MIRTRTMDEQAEYGVAAHWKYKEGLEGHDKLDERLAWVSQLLENQRVSEDSGNLLHDLKSDLLPEEVFAFTPKGDVINLPAGANCIDFAMPSTAAGNRMVGCKVNNRIVPIDHVVVTGEIIEVTLGPADKRPQPRLARSIAHQRGQEQDTQLVQEDAPRISSRAVDKSCQRAAPGDDLHPRRWMSSWAAAAAVCARTTRRKFTRSTATAA